MCDAHTNAALFAPGRAARSVLGPFQLGKDGLGFLKECLTGTGQLDAAGATMEKPDIEFALERADLLTQWWLLYAESLGCTGDVPLLGDREKVA
jgi:hypothetical protein